MAKQYDNKNKGTLGKNKRKNSDSHPDYSGQLNVDGREYWLSGWLKENGQTGEKFFSLSVKPKEQQGEESQVAPKSAGGADDDVPF